MLAKRSLRAGEDDEVLAVANQKGGVGKSTLTVRLAYAATEAGLRVLLMDMNRQGSLSLSFPSCRRRATWCAGLAALRRRAAGGIPGANR